MPWIKIYAGYTVLLLLEQGVCFPTLVYIHTVCGGQGIFSIGLMQRTWLAQVSIC